MVPDTINTSTIVDIGKSSLPPTTVGAGQTSQGSSSVAIGTSAEYTGQQTKSVAIGHEAGSNFQGASSILDAINLLLNCY